MSFGISIILTRLLSPQEYGIMGMAVVIIAFAHVFLDLGFNRAIIQQAEISQVQYATIFYLNTGIALLLTGICFFLAGPLAAFYHQPLIKPVFRVVSLSFLINGLNLVPSAILYKRLHFKVNSIQSLIGALLSGAVGIWMAYNGYGVWSLVMQSLLSSLILMLLNFAYIRWYPRLQFSIASIRPLWSYGSKLFASGLLDNIYSKLDTFIIGRIFTPSILGFYARAQSMDGVVRQFSANSIVGALFPYIAKHQDDKAYLGVLFRKYLHIIMFVSVGISGVLFLIAKDLFTLMFTGRWIYSAELFRIISIAGFAWPVSSLMCSIISGVGNSEAFFKLEVIKKILILPVYLFGFLLGLKGFLYCMLAVVCVSVILNAVYTAREIEVGTMEQIKIMAGYLITGLLSCTVTYFLVGIIGSAHAVLNMAGAAILFSALFLGGCYAARLKGTEIIGFGIHKVKLLLQ